MSRHRRRTVRAKEPKPAKRTAHREDPGSTDSQRPIWSFRRGDWDGRWPPNSPEFGPEVVKALAEHEGMTWAEIKQATKGRRGTSKSHSIDVATGLTDAGKKRAREIRLDTDEVFSLRIGGKKRIIGVRRGAMLEILWYDRNHEVARQTGK